jgi:predicted HTH transcriptional regulator
MLPRYLQDWILQGEGIRLDFNHSIADCHKIAISLVSFANTIGGTLIVGVDDRGRVVGVDKNEEPYMLEIAATKYCRPSLPIILKEHKMVDGKTVIECNINTGTDKPYLCRNIKGRWKAYYREGDQCKLASVVRYHMMSMENQVKGATVLTDSDNNVIKLLNENSKGLSKNSIGKKLSMPNILTVKVLSKLMYLNVVKEYRKLNKILYIMV